MIVKGSFAGSIEYFRFIQAFEESELSQPRHHVVPPATDMLGRCITFEMNIAEHAEFLLKHSLQEGLLCEWKNVLHVVE